jgi:hypothetical protein
MFTFKKIFVVLLSAAAFFSCTKKPVCPIPPPEPSPNMVYFNLNDRVVKPNQNAISIDVNTDGRKDLFFGVMMVGDPILKQDKWEFMVTSDLYTLLAVNLNEEMPVMEANTLIPTNTFSGYFWYGASSIMMVQKVISFDRPDYWEGHWMHATKKYLPFQLVVNARPYTGWIELTVDTDNERIILHRGAICSQSNVAIKAGI